MMANKENEVRQAYGKLVDDFVDTSNDPEASGDGGGDAGIPVEQYLANPEKFAAAAKAQSHAGDPLGLGNPWPQQEVEAAVRSPESVAAEEVRYIRQAIQAGAKRIRTRQDNNEVMKHMCKMLSEEELGKVEFIKQGTSESIQGGTFLFRQTGMGK